MYRVKARYYADPDQFGESFVITSDNYEKDLKLEIGQKIKIVPLCSRCEREIYNNKKFCKKCYEKFNIEKINKDF